MHIIINDDTKDISSEGVWFVGMSDGSFHPRVGVRGTLWACASPRNPGDNLVADGNSGQIGKGGGVPFGF